MDKEYTCTNTQKYNRNTCETEFTEYGFDTMGSNNELMKNVSEKSIILAPFNSTLTDLPSDLCGSVKELIVPRKVLKFAARCKEIDRQYEKNNNCELDNGVYNKAVEDGMEDEVDDKDLDPLGSPQGLSPLNSIEANPFISKNDEKNKNDEEIEENSDSNQIISGES
jgi:hypothetical protein